MRLFLPAAIAAIAAAPLTACGPAAPPPLAGNLTDTVADARGAHAGSFRGPDNAAGDQDNATAGIEPAAANTTQGNTQ